jgi:polyphosphate kinase 2 (PPK2 family)
MFKKTDVKLAPWVIIKGNKKMDARVHAIEHVLNTLPYKEA